MTLEKMGIPTAPMVTIAFKDLAKTNAANRGMPDERICFTPHPVWGKTDAQMYAYLEGNDPVTGNDGARGPQVGLVAGLGRPRGDGVHHPQQDVSTFWNFRRTQD